MSSNKSIKNFNKENIYSSSENDSLKESSEILKNNEKILTIDKKRKFELLFEVLNALSAPNSHPVISLNVRPVQ